MVGRALPPSRSSTICWRRLGREVRVGQGRRAARRCPRGHGRSGTARRSTVVEVALGLGDVEQRSGVGGRSGRRPSVASVAPVRSRPSRCSARSAGSGVARRGCASTTSSAAPMARLATSAAEVGDGLGLGRSTSAAARSRMAASSASAAGSWSRRHGVGLLAGLLDDAAGLGLGVGQLGLVLVEHAARPRPWPTRRPRGRSRIRSVRASMPFLMPG